MSLRYTGGFSVVIYSLHGKQFRAKNSSALLFINSAFLSDIKQRRDTALKIESSDVVAAAASRRERNDGEKKFLLAIRSVDVLVVGIVPPYHVGPAPPSIEISRTGISAHDRSFVKGDCKHRTSLSAPSFSVSRANHPPTENQANLVDKP